MKSIVLAFLLGAQFSVAQTYRLNYQPKVGSVAKHEIVINVRGKSSDEPSAPEINAKVLLHSHQTFTRVTSKEVAGDLFVKLIALSETTKQELPPDFKAWQKGTRTKFSYAPHSPFAFLDLVAPPAEKGDMNATGFVPAPAIPSAKVTVGEYWDVTKSMFTNLNQSGLPSKAADLSAIAQAVTQFLEVDSSGVGRFETRATLPLDIVTGFLDMKMDLQVNSSFGIHMATSALRSLDTRSQVTIEAGGGTAVEGTAAPKSISMTIDLDMRVRELR